MRDLRLEASRLVDERDRAIAEHRRFVSLELPALLTQAIGGYSLENAELRRVAKGA